MSDKKAFICCVASGKDTPESLQWRLSGVPDAGPYWTPREWMVKRSGEYRDHDLEPKKILVSAGFREQLEHAVGRNGMALASGLVPIEVDHDLAWGDTVWIFDELGKVSRCDTMTYFHAQASRGTACFKRPLITRSTSAVVVAADLEKHEDSEEELLARDLQNKLTALWYDQSPASRRVIVF